MGGTDQMDANLNVYRIGVRGKKWWWPIFTWLVDVSIQNAWILQKSDGRNMSLLEFRRQIAQCWLTRYKNMPKHCGRPQSTGQSSARILPAIRYDRLDHFVEYVPNGKRRRCAGDNHKGSAVRTQCQKCGLGLCRQCSGHLQCRRVVYKRRAVHNSRIWSNSEICNIAKREFQRSNALLLGDEEYGIRLWLMVPFRNPNTPAEHAYNNLQGSLFVLSDYLCIFRQLIIIDLLKTFCNFLYQRETARRQFLKMLASSLMKPYLQIRANQFNAAYAEVWLARNMLSQLMYVHNIVIFSSDYVNDPVTDEDSGEQKNVVMYSLPGSQLRAECKFSNYDQQWDSDDEKPLSNFVRRKPKKIKKFSFSKRVLQSNLQTWIPVRTVKNQQSPAIHFGFRRCNH
nr:unnamed protein product [Callosobruchus chinensis]